MSTDRDMREFIINELRTQTALRHSSITRVSKLLRWESLTDWDWDDPFIGIPASTSNRSHDEDINQIYKRLGQERDAPHRCKPKDSPILSTAQIDFPRYALSSYSRDGMTSNMQFTDSVIEVSKELYPLLADSETPYEFRSKHYLSAVENMTAVVCRNIVQRCPDIESVVPVRLNLPFCPAYTRTQEREFNTTGRRKLPNGEEDHATFTRFIAVNYALAVRWIGSTSTILLPVAVIPMGGRRDNADRRYRKYSHSLTASWPWNGGNADNLQRKFEGSPLINITDVELFSYRPPPEDDPSYFGPRKYSPTWRFRHKISRGDLVGPMWVPNTATRYCIREEVHQNWSYYTSIRALFKEVRRTGMIVHWKNKPPEPFERIFLDEFDLVAQNYPEATLPAPQKLVNGSAACDMFADCYHPASEPYTICVHHLQKTQALLNTSSLTTSILEEYEPLEWPLVEEIPLEKQEFLRKHIELIRQYQATKQVWVVDMEGITTFSNDYAALPSQIAIVNLFDRTKQLYTNINWGKSISDVLDVVYMPQYKQHPNGRSLLTTFFAKAYATNQGVGLQKQTDGKTIQELRKALHDLGVQEDKCVIMAWGSANCDYEAIARAFSNTSDIMVDKKSLRYPFKRFHLMGLVRRATNASVFQLKVVYHAMFPDRLPVNLWHHALVDAIAEAEIARETVKRLNLEF